MKTRRGELLLTLLVALSLCATVSATAAQVKIAEAFGASTSNTGDSLFIMNGAVIVGSTETGAGGEGVLVTHPDSSGAVLVPAPTKAAEFGFSLGGGADFDGDGIDDMLIGARWGSTGNPWPDSQFNGSVLVVSGLDGTTIREHVGAPLSNLGFSVELLDDVNGDLARDYAVGAPFERTLTPGQVFIFSGATGALLQTLGGSATPDRFGIALANLECDLDADGVDEFAVGASFRSTGGLLHNGVVHVFSGASMAPLLTIAGQSDYEALGRVLAPLKDDADGSGKCDLLAYRRIGGVLGPNGVSVLSMEHGSVIAHVFGTIEGIASFGQSIDSIADVSGDGRRDVILANADQNGGSVYVASSVTGQILLQIDDDTGEPHGQWGKQAASLGTDLDGDGKEDLVLTSPVDGDPNDPSTGSYSIYSTSRLIAGGGISALSAGGSLTFHLSAGVPYAGRNYVLVASASGTVPGMQVGSIRLPLNWDPVLAMSLAAANVPPFVNTFGQFDPVYGRATAVLDLSHVRLPPGTDVLLDVAYVAQGGSGAWDFVSNVRRIQVVN